MTPPVIRYVANRDGSRVAYHLRGKGPAVMMVFPFHVNHLALNWRVPLHRGAMQYLARYFTVINLDFRGAGLSTRRVHALSLASFAEDIESILDQLAVERVALCALGAGGLAAARFTRDRPGRVTNLVLVQSGRSEANRRVLGLRRANGNIEADVRGAMLGGVGDKANASALADVARRALDSDSLRQWERLWKRNDGLSIAAGLTTPALCVHAADDELVTLAAARALAESMPNAVLMTVPGTSGMAVWRDREAVQAIARFLGRGFGVETDVLRAQRKQRGGLGTRFPGGLSEREVEVLGLLATGSTNRQIAEQLFISTNTVSYHLQNILRKTGTRNRTEAGAFAHRNGLA